jgi:hypothetical protein
LAAQHQRRSRALDRRAPDDVPNKPEAVLSRAISDFTKLSPPAQAAIVAVTAWNLYLSAAAEWDIQHRPAAGVRGSRTLWRLACVTNTVGPLSYFHWGRR